ncbi:MAG: hypothetical protein LBS39_00945 [Campylobacteraceae bacterium]|jgi:hypothetical protein|nr:hypothetical protein [Campylobacteraceae bacterium]
MRYALSILVILLTFTGCSYVEVLTSDDAEKNLQEQTVVCKNGSQCDLYWQRAIFYITTNSKYKINILHDNIIETRIYDSSEKEVDKHEVSVSTFTYRALKEPLDEKTTRIHMSVGCFNSLSARDKHCWPASTFTEAARFKTYVENSAMR